MSGMSLQGHHYIPPNKDPEMRKILRACLHSTPTFARIFMADTFYDADTWQHREAWKIIDNELLPKSGICGWRALGKTTMNVAKVAKGILFRQQPFTVQLSKTQDKAARVTESVKRVILSPRVQEVFGNINPKKADLDANPEFNKWTWFACDPETGQPFACVNPFGNKQDPRGLQALIGGRIYRPTLIYVDDLESDEDVDNGETRAKIRQRFYAALQECVGRSRPDPRTNLWKRDELDPEWMPPWRIICTDTLKHHDALIARHMASDDWVTIRLPQADYRIDEEDGEKKLFSLVPELISDEQVRKEAATAKAERHFDVYCREKLCLPVSPENADWSEDTFKYYSEDRRKLNNDNSRGVFRFLVVDPARTSNEESADTAILAVGVDAKANAIYLRKLRCGKIEIKDVPDLMIKLAIETNSRVVGVEDAGLKDHLRWSYQNAIEAAGININFVWLNAKERAPGDFGTGRDAIKRARAAMILPWYQRGNVYHEDFFKGGPLEFQMLSYPRCSRWDAMDCVGYIPKMLEEGGVYFDPVETDPEKRQRFEEDTYDNTEWEEAIESGSWRLA